MTRDEIHLKYSRVGRLVAAAWEAETPLTEITLPSGLNLGEEVARMYRESPYPDSFREFLEQHYGIPMKAADELVEAVS